MMLVGQIKQQLSVMKNTSTSLTLVFLLVFHSFFASIPSLNWQGYGNVSASNLTDIWDFINDNIDSAVLSVSNSSYDEFNTKFSDHLNKLWDPAWNIVTITTVVSADAILYGYAFRYHWMWYNGHVVQGKILNFVIWKDYNCQGWITIGESKNPSTFTAIEQQDFFSVLSTITSNVDIWAVAHKMFNDLGNTASFGGNDRAYSTVMCQRSTDVKLYARVCAVGNKQALIDNQDVQIKMIVFQTR